MEQNTDLAASLLSMPKGEFQKFVRDNVRKRTMTPIVVRLNREALSNDLSKSQDAAAALRKIGFPD